MAKKYILTEQGDSKKILLELQNIKSKINALDNIIGHSYSGKQVLTNDELMTLLGVSRGTLHNYRSQGLITYSKVNGSIFYQYSDVQLFLEKHKLESFS